MDVAVSFWSSCGVAESGRLECWGHVPGDVPAGVFSEAALGWHHGCALRTSGQVACWGRNDHGQADAPSGDGFTAVFAAENSSCALDAAGSAVCWGEAGSRQVVMPAGPWVQMFPSRGDPIYHDIGPPQTCGLRVSGEVVCWSGGVLADPGEEAARRVRSSAEPKREVRWGASGEYGRFRCGLGEGGRVWCEGSGLFGGPHVPPGVFTGIEQGAGFVCGLRDDAAVVCWSGTSRARGPGELGGAPEGEFVQVSAAGDMACALSSEGMALCWSNDPPRRLSAPQRQFTAVAAAFDREQPCGLTAGGRVVCWSSRVEPRAESPVFASVSLGPPIGASCGIDAGGGLVCWGGDGSRGVRVLEGFEGEQVGVSSYGPHLCAVGADGRLGCVDRSGVGDGEVLRPPGGVFVDVAVSAFHGCALTVEGAVVCWGDDHDGDVPDRPIDGRLRPGGGVLPTEPPRLIRPVEPG